MRSQQPSPVAEPLLNRIPTIRTHTYLSARGGPLAHGTRPLHQRQRLSLYLLVSDERLVLSPAPPSAIIQH